MKHHQTSRSDLRPTSVRPPSGTALPDPSSTSVPIPVGGGTKDGGRGGEGGRARGETEPPSRDEGPVETAKRLLARIERLAFEELSRVERLELAADAIATARSLLGGEER